MESGHGLQSRNKDMLHIYVLPELDQFKQSQSLKGINHHHRFLKVCAPLISCSRTG